MDLVAVIQIRLTNQVAELFKDLCKANGVTVSQVIRDGIYDLINRGSIYHSDVQNEDSPKYVTNTNN